MNTTAATAIGRTSSQMQADHHTMDASVIATRTGMWLLRIDAPIGQSVRGGELYCVPGSETDILRTDGVYFVQYGREYDAVYDYEGTITDLTPVTERLTFTLTLFDPAGRAVARFEQVRAPKRTHTVESMRADFERQKLVAKERLALTN